MVGNEIELKPCPFCGSHDVELRQYSMEAMVACNDCGSRTGIVCLYPDASTNVSSLANNAARMKELTSTWNTRPTATNGDKDAVIALLEAAVSQFGKELPELTAQNAKLREALTSLRDYGCPVCNGDCGSANPPVTECPMRNVAKVLRETKP